MKKPKIVKNFFQFKKRIRDKTLKLEKRIGEKREILG